MSYLLTSGDRVRVEIEDVYGLSILGIFVSHILFVSSERNFTEHGHKLRFFERSLAAQRLASPAKAGIGGEMPKGQKSQWCESHPKAETTPLLSGGSGVRRVLQDGLIFIFICYCVLVFGSLLSFV